MSATLPNILDARLIKLYQQGDAETRSQVRMVVPLSHSIDTVAWRFLMHPPETLHHSQVEAALELLTNQLDTAAAT
eukprot:7313218-Pyramimonas_sp.AAC.2